MVAGSRPRLDRLLANVRQAPGQVFRVGNRGLPAIGVADCAAVRLADQLLVAGGVVGDPDRRSRFGGRLGLDRDMLEAVVLPLEADVVLGPEPLQDRDPLGQALDAILVGDVVGLRFDLIPALLDDAGAGHQHVRPSASRSRLAH